MRRNTAPNRPPIVRHIDNKDKIIHSYISTCALTTRSHFYVTPSRPISRFQALSHTDRTGSHKTGIAKCWYVITHNVSSFKYFNEARYPSLDVSRSFRCLFIQQFLRLKTSLVKMLTFVETCFAKAVHMYDIEPKVLIAWEVVSASESGEIHSVGRYRFLAGAVSIFVPLIDIHSYSQID